MALAGWVLLLAGAGAALYLWLYSTASSHSTTPQAKHSEPKAGVQLCHVNAYGDVDEETETNIDIIAVHGLDTNSPETWEDKRPGKPTVNWLADKTMLPQEVSCARIFTCDWPADLFRNSNVEENSMDELARLLLEGILRRPQPTSKESKNRPILFIASCLGGIILMKALEMTSGKYRPIREATRGVIFLATPFNGTSFEKVAGWAEPGLRTWALIRGQRITQLLDWVNGDKCDLDELVRRFTTLYQEKAYKVHTFYEKGFTDLSRKVPLLSFLFPSEKTQLVNKRSATLPTVQHPLPLERNHVRMNKFRGPKDFDPDYKLVADQIRHCLEEIQKGTPLEEADAWIRENHYNEEKLRIERLSGKSLVMEECYINLALLELQRADNSERRSNEPSSRSSPFSLSDRLKVETPHKNLQVELAKLFQSRKLPDGRTKEPRRILIRGRAGVGKTTLCKKIVYNFLDIDERMWREHFTRVLWVQLRKLKTWSTRKYNLGEMFSHIYFEQCQNGASFAEELWRDIKDAISCRTLFILDGLDEVSELLEPDHNAFEFLVGLLNRPHVIITTRPHTTLPSDVKTPDLELDTTGFYPDQVQKYLEAVLLKDDAEKIRSFLQKNRLLQSLVRIPIQLDALCLTWNENLEVDPIPETMTAAYKAIVERLWRKDIKRLDKEKNIKDLLSSEVAIIVEPENKLLEGLAFSGLYSNVIEFQLAHRDALHKHSWPLQIKIRLNEMFGRLSFIRTSDPSADPSTRSYHFLHLTFQEFFAAKYFARKWKDNDNLQYLNFNRRKNNCREISCDAFFQQHKYTARYDIFWRFVAGLLDDEGKDESTRFFKALERKPIDLLGPTHQRLVMNCLREAVFLPFEIRSNREKRLKDWVLFEINLTGSSTFTRESELPDGVLQDALGASRNKRAIIDNLQYSGRHMSDTTTTALVELLKDENSNVRRSAASALYKQSTLSETTMNALVELFKDENSKVRRSAAEALGKQSTLPETTMTALVELFKDENSKVRRSAAEALGKQSTLPETTMNALVELFKDENSKVRRSAAEALGKQSTLSETTMTALVELLKDEDSNVRPSVATALGKQSTLSETTMTALVELFKHEDWNVRMSAASALGKQSTLSETTMTALVELFKHEDSNVRMSAVSALGTQSNLMDKVLDALGLVIRSESQAEMQASVFCYPQHIGPLYESFLRRSFQEQFSLCIDDSFCIVSQPSGLRTVGLEDISQVQTAVQNGRCNLRNISKHNLWDTFEGEDA